MTSPKATGPVTSEAETTPAEEAHRLARDPAAVDGLKLGKAAERAPAPSADRRSAEGGKPYTTETETYAQGPAKDPRAPAERGEATEPPRR